MLRGVNHRHQRLGRAATDVYRLGVRARAKVFTAMCSGAFDSFGEGSTLQLPIRLQGEEGIAVGSGVFVGAGAWLQTLDDGRLEIGDGCSFAGNDVLSAAASIRIGPRVLFARNVYVADHRHAFADDEQAVLDQSIEQLAPVEVGAGAWLGQNVVVGHGVRIGRGAVVGANAVVLSDIPDRAVAVGAPARVVRQLGVTS
jgi:acetyltransferase-like isoleucine patch superfamily enzyme